MEDSKIEWTDHTFNPWVGCTKISPGCDHCYAEGWSKRSGMVKWGGDRRLTSDANWEKPVKWDFQAEREGVRKRVFCASLADVFDNQVPDHWRMGLWNLIRHTTNLDWLLLTKRPQNIHKMLPYSWSGGWDNVWLGTTVEDQDEADRRIPHLQAIHAKVRFLSCEPLLEPVEPDLRGIDWVICGGESGGGARFMAPEWAGDLLVRCKLEGVAFFMKQMTKKAPIPASLMVREFPC